MSASGLAALDASIAALPAPSRPHGAAAACVAAIRDRLTLDEDDIAAATRRGLLLAAASGDPRTALGDDDACVTEVAADLHDLGAIDGVEAALEQFAEEAATGGLVHLAEAARAVASDRSVAARALAVVLLHEELAGG